MLKSLFHEWVSKFFGPVALKVVEKLNEVKDGQQKYMFKTMLKKQLSTTLKWGSLSSNNTIVSADVVALDSSLPLKKRDSIAKHEGEIPKLGMKLYMNERTMQDIEILRNQPGTESQVSQKIFEDTSRVIGGIYEIIEFMFLQALSTGVALIEDDKNVGLGIRVDYGHPNKNKYGAITAPWSSVDATPIDDIDNVLTEAMANGDSLSYILMDRATFNKFRTNKQVKELYGFSLGFTGTQIPTPNFEQLNNALSADKGIVIQLVERTVTFERNGKRTKVKPWAENAVVFLSSLENVGTLSYGRLAEEGHPVENVVYQKVDDYILVSKYHKNDPLQEFTSSQALAVPVIDNVESIYILNCEDAVVDAQIDGDANFAYKGTNYTKASVVNALNIANPESAATLEMTDKQLQNRINKLNEEQVLAFEEEIIEA